MGKYNVMVLTAREVYADNAEQAMKMARESGYDTCVNAVPVQFGDSGLLVNSDLLHRAAWLIQWAAACADAGNFFEQVGSTPEPFPISMVWKAWKDGDAVTIEVVEKEEKKIARMMAL